MMNMRFRRQAWRLRFSLWFARLRGQWQDFSDRWRVPPVITSRWFILGSYFLVILVVSMAWFGRPTLDWQGAQVPNNVRGSSYDIDFQSNPTDDIAPSPNEPNRSFAMPGDWAEDAPTDSKNPALPVQENQPNPAQEPVAPTTGSQTPSLPSADRQPAPPAGVQPPTEALAKNHSLPISYLRYPVTGDLTNPYALVSFSSTMKDWRAHLAVDLAATAGTDVLAAAAGTVKQILPADVLWGTVVVLSHGDDCTTSYSNLQNITVKVGQSVTAGQVLGKLAGSPPAEQLELSHLHFALMVGQDAVDPTALFK